MLDAKLELLAWRSPNPKRLEPSNVSVFVHRHPQIDKAETPELLLDQLSLSATEFEEHRPTRSEKPRSSRGSGAEKIGSIRPAVEREQRFVHTYVTRKVLKCIRRDV